MITEIPTQDTQIHYLYRITNKINCKIYIGQTINPAKRWIGHKTQSKANIPTQIINKAMKKYGIDNFEFEVIASCRGYDNANWMEEELIKQHNSLVSNGNGYNMSLGGETAPKSEAFKQIMSKRSKERWNNYSPEEKIKIINRLKEAYVPRSKESFQKQSETMKQKCEDGWMPVNIFTSDTAAVWKGKKFSEKHRQAISKSLMGREVSKETRRKISEAQKGKIISEETREKLSEVAKGQHRSPNTEFQKGSVPWNKGKSHSEESRAKMSASKKGKHYSPATQFKPKFLSDNELIQIQDLLSQKKSLRQIEAITGINRHFISKELKRIGIK